MRKAFICPTKYVQGPDEILNLGYFVKSFGDSALLIARPDDVARVKDKLDATCEKFGVVFVESNFGGECSRQEIARLKEVYAANQCSCIVGLGGGKALDTAKCVAEGEKVIIVPTIAATDAPTSHSAVLYTPDGAFDDYAYFKVMGGDGIKSKKGRVFRNRFFVNVSKTPPLGQTVNFLHKLRYALILALPLFLLLLRTFFPPVELILLRKP